MVDERLDTLDTLDTLDIEDVLGTFVVVTVTDVTVTDDEIAVEAADEVVLTVPAVEQTAFTVLTTVFSESISASLSGPATLQIE